LAVDTQLMCHQVVMLDVIFLLEGAAPGGCLGRQRWFGGSWSLAMKLVFCE